MTQKDLRDIAAYYGALCTHPFSHGSSVEPLVLEQLDCIAFCNETVDFKLQLRKLSALTDEELVCCMELLKPSGCAIMRTDAELYLGNYRLNVHTGELYDRNSLSVESAAVYAYLQSIGVYIPGCIDPQYVQLIEP